MILQYIYLNSRNTGREETLYKLRHCTKRQDVYQCIATFEFPKNDGISGLLPYHQVQVEHSDRPTDQLTDRSTDRPTNRPTSRHSTRGTE